MIRILLAEENSYPDTDDFDGKCGYSYGPEYSKGELEKLRIIVENKEEVVSSWWFGDNNLDSSRLHNLHWCTCGHCSLIPSLIESKCTEFAPLSILDIPSEEAINLLPSSKAQCLCLTLSRRKATTNESSLLSFPNILRNAA
jgi:hypothetical protein